MSMSPFFEICFHCPILHRRNVIWLADTNYRIDLDNAAVRTYAETNDFDPLIAADQV